MATTSETINLFIEEENRLNNEARKSVLCFLVRTFALLVQFLIDLKLLNALHGQIASLFYHVELNAYDLRFSPNVVFAYCDQHHSHDAADGPITRI